MFINIYSWMRKQRLEFIFLSQKKPEKRRLPFISSVEIQIPVSNINDHFPFRLAMIPDPLLYTQIKISPRRQIFRPQTVYRTRQWSPVYIEHQSKDKHATFEGVLLPSITCSPAITSCSSRNAIEIGDKTFSRQRFFSGSLEPIPDWDYVLETRMCDLFQRFSSRRWA